MIGKTVSHYHIMKKVGEGGMGVVYKAEDTKLRRTVALKFLPPELTRDKEAKERFFHEARAAAALDHANICSVYEIGETPEGQLFIVMGYYEGETLKERMKNGPLPIDEAVEIARQIAAGLKKAHGKGIVHRDVKPANIFVTRDKVVKILDFGIAKLAGGETKLTKTGTTMGTAAYMSPEQAMGKEVDQRSDIWSLGVILYEMLTGKLPFQGDFQQAILYAIINESPQPPTQLRPEIPKELEGVVQKALEKEKRYKSLEEFTKDLGRAVDEPAKRKPLSNQQRASASSLPLALRPFRLRPLPAVLTLAFLAAVGIVLWQVIPNRQGAVAPNKIENSIAVIGFDNLTGDPAYDKLRIAIPNLLITNLEQTGFFQVVTWERLRDLLKQTGGEDVQTIDRDLGLDLCLRQGVQAIVVGSFIKTGDLFTTDLKVLDVESKRLLTAAKSSGEGEASIVRTQVDELSKKIAAGLGLPAQRLQSVQWRVADVTTASMEAYDAFLKGRDNIDKYYFDDARRALEQAVAVDPTFASAYLFLSRAYSGLRNITAQTEALKKARKFASRATEKERLYIDAGYVSFIERNESRQAAILEELTTKYPQEKSALCTLGSLRLQNNDLPAALDCLKRALALDPQYGRALFAISELYAEMGDFARALDCSRKLSAANPGDAAPHELLGNLYFKMGRLDEALSEFERIFAIKPDYGSAEKIAAVLMIKGDYTSASRWVEQWSQLTSSPGTKGRAYFTISLIKHLTGQYSRCETDMRLASEYTGSAGNRYGQAVVDLLQSQIDLELNRGDRGRRSLLASTDFMKRYTPSETDRWQLIFLIYSALFDCQEGKTAAANRNLSKALALLPRTEKQDWLLHTSSRHLTDLCRAEILLKDYRAREAIALLQNAAPPATPTLFLPSLWSHNWPFLQDTLARAYVQAGDLDKALREYEALVSFDPKGPYRLYLHPKYWYRLAKLYEQKGERDKAAAAYEKFLDLWSLADQGLAELEDGKDRLKAVQGAR